MSDAEWEDIAVGPVVSAPASEWEDVAIGAPAASKSRGAMSALGEVGQGLTFGFLPEIEGATSAVGNALASVFGGGNGRGFAENYAAKRDASEAELKAFENDNYWGSMGLQLAGGLIPAAAGGAARATLGAAKAAPGLLSSLARNVFGVGITEAPTVASLAKMGLTQGALMGAGNAEEGQRLRGAAIGGTIGAVAAPVVGKSIEYGTKTIADKLAEVGLLRPGMLASERGAIGGPTSPIADSLTPEDLILAKQLKNTPVEKVLQGADELAQAADEGLPLFLPEAVKSPKVERNAKFIANYEPSLEFSQSAIRNRTAGAETRAGELFDKVTPNRDTFLGARNISKGAKDIIEAADKARQEASAPWYKQAYETNPIIESPQLTELLAKDKILSGAVASLKKTANNADLPDNSTELLVKARKRLWEKASDLEAKGFPSEAMDIKDTYNTLNGIMKGESQALAVADEAYAAGSRELDALGETLIPSLANTTADKAENISRLMNLPAKRIEDLRGIFKEAGKLQEWEDGVRSYLQRAAESSREGQNFVLKIAANTEQKSRIKAALGEKADDVLKGLDLENRFFEGKNKYFMGSPTQPIGEEQKNFKSLISKIKNIPSAIFDKIMNADLDEKTAQALSRIYFDSKTGAEALGRILPVLQQYETNAAAARLSGSTGASAITRGAGELQEQLTPKTAPAQQAQSLTRQQPLFAQPSSQPKSSNTQNGKASLVPDLLNNLKKTTSTADANQDSSFMNTMFKGDTMEKAPAAQVFEEIRKNPVDHAIMLMESNGDPKAKNPDSSASGLFQLIKKTASSLGVKDVFDPADNYAGYLKLKEDTIKRFGKDDVFTIYAAHYLGAPTLKKWMDGGDLTPEQADQVQFLKSKLFPKLERIYSRLVKAPEVVEA